MNLEKEIEAVLFYKAEPIKKTALAEIFDVDIEKLEENLTSLQSSLSERGITLVVTDTEAQLVVRSEYSELIDNIKKDELKKDIGKAGAETLAIILYRGPVSRAQVDKIRGVNSAFIIRNLLVRGLVEKRTNPQDSRSFLYAATPSLLNHLGIEKREDMPDFGVVMDSLDTFEEHANAEQPENNPFVNNE